MTAPEVRYGIDPRLYPEESYYAVVEVRTDPEIGEKTRTVLDWYGTWERATAEVDRLRAAQKRAA